MKNVLIVIDVQKGFITNKRTEEVAKRIVQLTRTNSFDGIIANQFINTKGSPFVRILGWDGMIASPDIDFEDGLAFHAWRLKTGYSCIGDRGFMRLFAKLSENADYAFL